MNSVPSGGPSDPVVTANSTVLLDRLRRLLQRQLELVRQGSLAAAVELFEQTDQCVRKIALTRGPSAARTAEQASISSTESWLCVERLYRELSMALAAQQAEVSAALNTIRQNKKVLKTYGSCLSSA
jgi:hypothetical protein